MEVLSQEERPTGRKRKAVALVEEDNRATSASIYVRNIDIEHADNIVPISNTDEKNIRFKA